jgi:hypothetical protein
VALLDAPKWVIPANMTDWLIVVYNGGLQMIASVFDPVVNFNEALHPLPLPAILVEPSKYTEPVNMSYIVFNTTDAVKVVILNGDILTGNFLHRNEGKLIIVFFNNG